MPDCKYGFEYRQAWAKFRRLAYMVPETEKLYRSLAFDQLQSLGWYDFDSFETENPTIEDEPAEVVAPEEEGDPKIEEAPADKPVEDTKAEEKPAEEAKAGAKEEEVKEKTAEEKHQEMIESFKPDTSKINIPEVDLSDPHVTSHPVF